MSAAALSEPTPAGKPHLTDGIAPILGCDRLRLRAMAPLGPKRPQKPRDCGLFDLAACDQPDLFTTEHQS